MTATDERRGSSPRARGTGCRSRPTAAVPWFIPACAGNSLWISGEAHGHAVHPRVRGEQGRAPFSQSRSCGSSPRARGTVSILRGALFPLRFIPACAGNSPAPRCPGRARPVHPRVRGEQESKWYALIIETGSSPRARGTGDRADDEHLIGRFIPACAGNRKDSATLIVLEPVHPRVRGEQAGAQAEPGAGHGSSPRARGTDHAGLFDDVPRRFIPACAGNRHRAAANSPRLLGSSPRARGTGRSPPPARAGGRFIPACAGNSGDSLRSASSADGSSPRARGTAGPGSPHSHPLRFIPACAGNSGPPRRESPAPAVHPRVRGEQSTPPSSTGDAIRFIPACAGNSVHDSFRFDYSPVHPRVRGEQELRMRQVVISAGSSPRARGTAAARPQAAHGRRFIPACAGNRRCKKPPSPSRAVHPRVRGEQPHLPNLSSAARGSSPRARGTAGRHLGHAQHHRFIPACAGNSSHITKQSDAVAVHPRVRGEQGL